jgi:GNAT superfamily N-acetyltransferase
MVIIRQIRQSDEQVVKEFIHGIMETEFPGDSSAFAYDDLDDLVDHYGGKGEVFFVAEEKGRLVGTVGIKRDTPDTALLRRIFVDQEHRGKGHGVKLLDAAIEFCRKNGYKTMMFHGTNRMRAAMQLCRKNGFVTNEISELGNFDLAVLSKTL